MTNQSTIEKLMRDHAYWADQVRTLQSQGQEMAARCDKHQAMGDFGLLIWLNKGGPANCIEEAMNNLRDMQAEDPHNHHSFEEEWEMIDPCERCKEVRRLKARRMNARRRLGQVRAAITRVGRRLSQVSDIPEVLDGHDYPDAEGGYRYPCSVCGEPADIICKPSEFDADGHYCGRSPMCCP